MSSGVNGRPIRPGTSETPDITPSRLIDPISTRTTGMADDALRAAPEALRAPCHDGTSP
jgi:hypothetical protein